MRTAISHNGYSIYKADLSEDILNDLKEELTVSCKNMFNENLIKQYQLFQENDKKIYIPRFFGLQRFGVPVRDVVSEHVVDCPRMVFEGELRASQRMPVDAFIAAANDPRRRGGIISVPCAGGKTVMAIYCACALGKKTLFIAHKDFLSTQFEERVASFVPSARIGIIKQNKVVVEDKDFVVASLQSLAMRDYDPEIFKRFGLVIIDECHHMSAEVFSRALLKVNAPVMMGLSATLNRKDGLRRVFEWFLGKPVLKIKKHITNDLHTEVRMIDFYDDDVAYNEVKLMWNGKVNLVGMLNNICNYTIRTRCIVDIINELLDKEPNRKIIVLSERRNQLNQIEEMLNGGYSTGYYVGGMSRIKLKESESKQIILATYQMASEGMDIPALNTLIMASPITSIEQSIGRIHRQTVDERDHIPIIIDIVDNFSIFKKKAQTRERYYTTKGYKVVTSSKRIKYNFVEEEDD